MNYKIRLIEEKDNKEIEQIIRTCLIEYGANHEGTAWTDSTLDRFSFIYNNEYNKYWVAIDENNNVVGGVGIGFMKGLPDICELQKMYCLKNVRGTGIANQLINTALKYASNYYHWCYLETLTNMIEAQKFYKKHGFKKVSKPIGSTGHYACDVSLIKEL